MTEYLIQGETLDNIANAINAKTGKSAAMTPAEMVTEIGSISGGGSDLSAVDVFVGDYLSTTDLIITVGAVNRYQRYLVGN